MKALNQLYLAVGVESIDFPDNWVATLGEWTGGSVVYLKVLK